MRGICCLLKATHKMATEEVRLARLIIIASMNLHNVIGICKFSIIKNIAQYFMKIPNKDPGLYVKNNRIIFEMPLNKGRENAMAALPANKS